MQNFEPTGAAAAMPGSAVPQIKRRLVISACLLIPLFYLGLGAAFGLPLPPFLTGDNAMWCGIVQLVLTVPVCWLNRTYFINGCKSIRAPGPDTLVALSSGAALVYGIIAIFTQDAPQELFLPSAAAILIFAAACQLLEVRFKAQAMAPLHSLAERIPETACVLRSPDRCRRPRGQTQRQHCLRRHRQPGRRPDLPCHPHRARFHRRPAGTYRADHCRCQGAVEFPGR